MAAEERKNVVYALIGNIPRDYHSFDLRNYFSQFIETNGFICFHFRHRPEVETAITELDSTNVTKLIDEKETTSNKQKQPDKTRFCCVVKLLQIRREELINMYHNKHWLDKKGDSIPLRCRIAKVKVKETESITDRYKTRKEKRTIPSDRETFTVSDLDELIELQPPAAMPHGNCGTPTLVFLQLIQECRLPPGVIKKLGLTFPKTRSNRRYGNVPFDYGGDIITQDMTEPEEVQTALGHTISNLMSAHNHPTSSKPEVDNGDTLVSDSDDDNDTCQEWERHEALHDDPFDVERNKERLFENEIELKWEKGGSGLVFYTDAQYWDEKEGDFDEQTADDWDVDMSVYYDPQGGDKDSRDYIKMRQERRRRKGIEDDNVFTKIGQFENHTKGIGRKVMESQGWKEGEGLGSTIPGIADALDNDGQHPKCKTGLGYFGEKVERKLASKKSRVNPPQYIISTVYDNVMDTDPYEPLLRRKNPHNLTYRHNRVQFTKAKETSNNS